MTVQEGEELGYKPLPSTRTDLNYAWVDIPLKDALLSLYEYLKRQKAKAVRMDVYASNGHVYRNLVIQLPWRNNFQVAENITIQFDRDEGRQLSIGRD